jgi:transcriptional regulatory protein LevR
MIRMAIAVNPGTMVANNSLQSLCSAKIMGMKQISSSTTDTRLNATWQKSHTAIILHASCAISRLVIAGNSLKVTAPEM